MSVSKEDFKNAIKTHTGVSVCALKVDSTIARCQGDQHVSCEVGTLIEYNTLEDNAETLPDLVAATQIGPSGNIFEFTSFKDTSRESLIDKVVDSTCKHLGCEGGYKCFLKRQQ